MASGDVQSLSARFPGGYGAEEGVVRRPGTEAGKCHRCSSAHPARCKTPALAFGSRPRERNTSLLPLERGTEGIRHTGWRRGSAGCQDKGQREVVRWEAVERGEVDTVALTVRYVARKVSRMKRNEEKKTERRRDVIRVSLLLQ